MIKKNFKKKTDKQDERVIESCNEENDIELNDDELESISGGIAPILGNKKPKP